MIKYNYFSNAEGEWCAMLMTTRSQDFDRYDIMSSEARAAGEDYLSHKDSQIYVAAAEKLGIVGTAAEKQAVFANKYSGDHSKLTAAVNKLLKEEL